MNTLSAQMTVCDEIETNYSDLSYNMHNVRSRIKVDTYPTVIMLNVLIKVFYRGGQQHSTYLLVTHQNKPIYKSNEYKLYMDGEHLGHLNDIVEDVRFPITEAGTYYIKYLSDDQVITQTPIFIV